MRLAGWIRMIGPRSWTLGAALAVLAIAPATAGADFTAPDPGGNEQANVSIPPPDGEYLGINDDFIDYAHSQSPTSYATYAHNIGANVVKMNLEWWRAQPAQPDSDATDCGTRDLDPNDNPCGWSIRRWQVWTDAYNAMQDQGITPIFMLTSAPCWASADPANCTPGALRFPPEPGFDQNWVDFVTRVATTFPHSIIQVWNEPNLNVWWRPSPDPARWAHLLKLAYDAVQSAETTTGVNTPVIGPGITNKLSTDSNGMSMADFLAGAYGAADPMNANLDALSVNLFPYSDQYGANTEFAASFQQLRQARSDAGDTGPSAAPIYITETGLGAGSNYGWPYSEVQRALAVYRLYNRLLTMPDVKMVVFHRLIEPRDSNQNPLEWGYAWLKYVPPADPQNPQTQAPGLPEPKAVYCLFTDLAQRTYQPCLTVNITSGPSGPTSNQQPTFTFEHPQAMLEGYQCRIDSEPFLNCTQSRSYAEPGTLPEGNHTFYVQGKDSAGDTALTTQNFTVILPDTTIKKSKVSSKQRKAKIAFRGTGAGTISFQCSLDGRAFSACTSPVVLRKLKRGRHTFSVRSVDGEGTVDATPAKVKLRIR